MKIELKTATVNEKDVLTNLMEKYIYEFSQYDLVSFNDRGLYDDPHLGSYFTENDRFPFLIYSDDRLAGLALVSKHAECSAPLDWSVAEFFVAYPYRRKGVGTFVISELFRRFRGVWQIRYHPKNEGSERFWQNIASATTGGNYEIMRGSEDYCDGTPSKVLVFKV